jgi:hypothetical protein
MAIACNTPSSIPEIALRRDFDLPADLPWLSAALLAVSPAPDMLCHSLAWCASWQPLLTWFSIRFLSGTLALRHRMAWAYRSSCVCHTRARRDMRREQRRRRTPHEGGRKTDVRRTDGPDEEYRIA